jgi:serine/threonine-protein kinase RsbW
MSNHKEEEEFGTGLDQLSRVLAFVEGFLEKEGLQEGVFEIQLAVEEWYVNIVKHGFGGKDLGRVKLSLSFSQGSLEVQIRDNASAFDPHSLPSPEPPKSVEEAKIGGLGVHFIRNLMDTTSYRRVDGWNIFSMYKHFPAGDEQ